MRKNSLWLFTLALLIIGGVITGRAVAAEPGYRFADLGVYHLDPDSGRSDDADTARLFIRFNFGGGGKKS